ncbi:MAG: hypothetical protein J6S54_05840 [Lentisphaeria bacterium]|nr:hypothetical protein [Lentisphaeria bacterium]
MKKMFIFVGMAVIGMFMSGCNDNPQRAVSEFAKALKKSDYQAAAQCLEDTKPEELAKGCAEKPELQKSLASIKPVSADINGNEATVKVQILTYRELKVKKINGKWKISGSAW